ncbi:GNAT family N-acetyltransferase [Flavicella marina]|uniref:GNAT family N-acetyltransferase n=1 Tax=Flavicella marina TaxID=1475951 RepID=UPI001264CA74|nr:GNAT family protein [Flavicella marina]
MIKGNIVGLRAVEKEDLSLFRDWRNLESFRKHFREVRELSLADQEAWFDSLQKTRHINFMFTIVDLETNKPIGAAGILYVNWINRSGDFSFYIGENEVYVDDKDLSKEAASLLIDYGFNNLNLNKIWMELYEFDSKKIQFFKELNFQVDGKLRANCFEDGKYWDSIIISLLKDDCT